MKRFLSGGVLDLNKDFDDGDKQDQQDEIDDNSVLELGKQVSDFYKKSIENSSTVQPIYYRNKKNFKDNNNNNNNNSNKTTVDSNDNDENSTSFYCKECEMDIKNSSFINHITSTIHNLSVREKSNYKPTKQYKIPKSNAGYRIMKTSLGWKEDQGLGRDNQGILDPIKVEKKNDKLGIGKEKPMTTTTTKTTTTTTTTPIPNKKQRQLKIIQERRREQQIRSILQDN